MKITSNYFEDFVKNKLVLQNNVFQPNLTTKLSYEAANENVLDKSNVLDLGCGSGIIGILIKKNNKKIKLFCSDNHSISVKLTKKNLIKNKINAIVKQGDLLSPWKGIKFDYIINDVSAISSIIASKTNWFSKNIPADCGNDGTKLSIKVIKNARNYLKKEGVLQLPLLNLSNTGKIMKEAKKFYYKSDIIKTEKWFLPENLMRLKPLFLSLKNKKKINFEEKFGKIICQTSIMICKL